MQPDLAARRAPGSSCGCPPPVAGYWYGAIPLGAGGTGPSGQRYSPSGGVQQLEGPVRACWGCGACSAPPPSLRPRVGGPRPHSAENAGFVSARGPARSGPWPCAPCGPYGHRGPASWSAGGSMPSLGSAGSPRPGPGGRGWAVPAHARAAERAARPGLAPLPVGPVGPGAVAARSSVAALTLPPSTEPGQSPSTEARQAEQPLALLPASGDARAWLDGATGSRSGVPNAVVPQAGQERLPLGISGWCRTLSMSGVPSFLTQAALLSILEERTPTMRGWTDFFYCPWNAAAECNFGFVIINFLSKRAATDFERRWGGRPLLPGTTGAKTLRIALAARQGCAENLEHFAQCATFQHSAVHHRPLVRLNLQATLQPLSFEGEAQEVVSDAAARSSGDT